MQGGVYSIQIQGHVDNLPHPHVVVLEFDNECLMIPAFSKGGRDVEERIALLTALGFSREVVCVELDNAKHVTWASGRSGKLACWCVWRNYPVPKRIINSATCLGRMDVWGLLAIVDCLLRYAAARPEQFAKKRVKKLKELAERLRATPDCS